MNRRDKLREIIKKFDLSEVTNFFISINELFKPQSLDLSFYLNDSYPDLSELKKIGDIDFSEAERLIVISCRSEKELTSRSGKRRQYDLAKKILKDEKYDAGIFIFYDNAGHFRFSLVVAHYTGTKRTLLISDVTPILYHQI